MSEQSPKSQSNENPAFSSNIFHEVQARKSEEDYGGRFGYIDFNTQAHLKDAVRRHSEIERVYEAIDEAYAQAMSETFVVTVTT